jgi:hypothetical protein
VIIVSNVHSQILLDLPFTLTFNILASASEMLAILQIRGIRGHILI